ncbi:WecB/TagA/CpsF family glycosyltransferase [Photobacterium sp. DA100]|uniref:WecB/TagA/CpsF family glycosyltransferase n=1 Tax=Photobacterium sp. DA100 TaxID=3027472 RepID=UPI00247A4C11|nr:WecB/TagA/CpsF family glycosyltransferase [Photobacterium sp. DA100]WEM41571.1 WecB/TagA/CpsF family glycosyltransferase [Photobacterium sp. DA100]
MTLDRVSFLGLSMFNNNVFEVCDYIEENVIGKGYQYLITPNVDHLTRLNYEYSDDFYQAYLKASIIVNDSRILCKVSQLLKGNLTKFCPGSDLTVELLRRVKDKRVYIVGSNQKSVDIVQKKFKIKNIDFYSPPIGFIENQQECKKIAHLIKEFSPDLIVLAVGSPRQEQLALKLSNENLNALAICVGASIDFISGDVKRAPLVFQRCSLEWLYRIIQEPRRLFLRYFVCFFRLFKIIYRDVLNRKTNEAYLFDE